VQDDIIWIGIAFCVTQSAIFSGLNLAFFSVSRLRLETAASTGNRGARRVLDLRRDSNFLLTTILWGNVGINVLLTLLSNSVLAGIAAFLFSTVLITFCGEIIPQAYFSRHALRMATLLSPLMRVYQWILFPVAKPSAIMLDKWLGKEMIEYLQERELRRVLAAHVGADESDVEHVEGVGALNFLDIDDFTVLDEGEPIDPSSVLALPTKIDLPLFPEVTASRDDEFVARVHASGKKWVVLTDEEGTPQLILDADAFLRSLFFSEGEFDPYAFCHRPIVIKDPTTTLDRVIKKMKETAPLSTDQAIVKDIVLLWHAQRRVITGADILGRLLQGITHPVPAPADH